MKKFAFIFTVFLVFMGVNSCKDQLDIAPSSLTEQGFFSNETEFESAVFGVYQKLIFFHNFRGGNWLHDLWLLPSDDLTSNGSYAFETFGSINETNGDVSAFFQICYQVIARANTVLEKQTERADAYESEELKQHHRGECLFLRAYANYLLWNHFETAPLISSRILNVEDAKAPSSSGTQLLDQAIQDWQEAAGLLPASWGNGGLGRATSGAAHGMAGKALLFRASATQNAGDYSAALGELNQVSGYSLLPVFGDNFDEAREHNAESLFEIQYGKNNINNIWLNNDAFAVVGDLGGYWGYFDGNGTNAANRILATQSLQDAFEPGDPRIADTFDSTAVKKYVNRPRANSSRDNYNNSRVLRYADVLLMKAEALNESDGNTQEAIALVNQIRDRARSADSTATVPAALNIAETDRAVIRQWIMEERRRELAFEDAHRWYDLRRWHKAGWIDLTNWNFSSRRADLSFDVSKHLVLPLPASELILNPNLQQNPGY